VRNVNIIGLQRAEFAEGDIDQLRRVFKRLYRSGAPQAHVIEELKADMNTPDIVMRLVESLQRTERGKKGRWRESLREEFSRQGAERLAAGASR